MWDYPGTSYTFMNIEYICTSSTSSLTIAMLHIASFYVTTPIHVVMQNYPVYVIEHTNVLQTIYIEYTGFENTHNLNAIWTKWYYIT